jgi:PmbA protein
MSYIDDIQAAFDAHGDVAQYRINMSERRSVGVGIRDNDVGSVYSPFSFGQGTGGGFLVQWQDGLLSRGNLDGNSLPIIADLLANARAAAYDDPDAAQFLGPQTVHDVPLWSDDVPPLFDEQTSYMLNVVRELQQSASRYEANTLNGGVGASMGQSWLRTSHGLDLSTRSTGFSASASFDGLVGEGLGQRTVPTVEEIVGQIDLGGQYLQPLRTETNGIASGTHTVVLHPDVAYSLWSNYVWGNIGGGAVYHGQSPFTIEQFRDNERVFRRDLLVTVEPWEPLGNGSFGYTGEGLPSAPATYIERGRLTQPILDLKYARRLHLPPTTPPGGSHSIRMRCDTETTWQELQPTLGTAILVLGVLGLHTQDRSSGTYSLATSQALLVRDGELVGRVKATLTGNFFDQLRSDELQFVQFAGQPTPGFALPVSVSIEQTQA